MITDLSQLVEKYKDRWNWCTLCRSTCVVYTCCKNTTCNAGGCDKCDSTYDEVYLLKHAGLDPKIDDIPGARERQRKKDLIWYMQNKDSIETEPEWWNRILEYYTNSGVPLMIPTKEEQENYEEPTFLDLIS